MLKARIETLIKESIHQGLIDGSLGELQAVPDTVPVEFTKSTEHGDRAISIAMKLTKEAKIPPRKIAESIVNHLQNHSEDFQKIDIAGPGFINLTLNWKLLNESICEIIKAGANYGKLNYTDRPNSNYHKILLEYVSANPTGDLHLGHGRGAVLGSSIANLLKWAGYDVSTEFYINDAGVQMEKLAISTKQALLIEAGLLDAKLYDTENNYPLESMQEFVNRDIFFQELEPSYQADLESISLETYGDISKRIFMRAQEQILSKAQVEFDNWYSEKTNLHNAYLFHHEKSQNIQANSSENLVTKVCKMLQERGACYEQDGALWFRATDHGDERDRVLRKADGNYTYLAADFAYHLEKFARGYDLLINLWGADHHGQIPGIKGGLAALGQDPSRLEIILLQLVSLSKNGQEVKMSKRKGDIVTMRELIEEVGVDAFRYFLVENQANNRMVFDLELASKQEKDNPVYYIQYAHARCSSILRNLCGPRIDQASGKELAPLISEQELADWVKHFQQDHSIFAKAFAQCDIESTQSSKALILSLANFPEEIKDAALSYAPYKIANYLKELAGLFHQFYTHNRVICEDRDLMQARVAIVLACKITIANALSILAISAPEKM